jgi:hypothetical protein
MKNDSTNYKEVSRFKKLFRETNTRSYLPVPSCHFSCAFPPSCSTHVKIQPLFSLLHAETLLGDLCQFGIYLLLYFTPNLLHFFLSFLLNLNLVLNNLSFIIFFILNKNHTSEIRKQFEYLMQW